MKDFIYEGKVTIIYGPGQIELVAGKIASMAKKVLLVTTSSFVGENLDDLTAVLDSNGVASTVLQGITGPYYSKINEGLGMVDEEKIGAVIGIGGGVCMDLAKSIAFGAMNRDIPLEKFLTREISAENRSHLPFVTIPTNPMSGSETNADVQITLDENGLQVGCTFYPAEFTWLNPEYVMSLPDKVLAYGQIAAFSQLSCNYLNLSRSMLAERYSEAAMKTILDCLRASLTDKSDMDARGTLMISSALSLSGINDLGREFEFVPYPLQSFAQRYLGLKYPQTMSIILPYWLKVIYRGSDDKTIFRQYFKNVLGINLNSKDDEALLQEALGTLKNLYKSYGIASCFSELTKDPGDHNTLVTIIDSFGPIPCGIMPVDTEIMAGIIEDAISGNTN